MIKKWFMKNLTPSSKTKYNKSIENEKYHKFLKIYKRKLKINSNKNQMRATKTRDSKNNKKNQTIKMKNNQRQIKDTTSHSSKEDTYIDTIKKSNNNLNAKIRYPFPIRHLFLIQA